MAKNSKNKKQNDETILSKTADMLVNPQHANHQNSSSQQCKHNSAKQKKQSPEYKD